MAFVRLNFSPALLLLMVICSLWRVGQPLPVTSKGPMTDRCVLNVRRLLENITNTLSQNKLFSGIDCTKQSVFIMETNTTSMCAPMKSTCLGIIKPEFNQESCLTNIGKDLLHYYKFLAAQPDPDSLLTPVQLSLRELMETCFTWSLPTDLESEKAATDRPSTYDERLNLCKVLKGFQVRTITINRVIAYMNSGECTK